MPVDAWAIDSLNFTGREVRLIESSTVMGDGTVLGSRSGVRPGDPGLTVSLSGSTINVSPGVATVFYSSQGVYKVAIGSTTSPGTLTAAHATLDRVDLVYLRVWDNAVDAGGLNQADIVYLAGTPAASPVAPTPAGTQIYLPLATITVPHSGGGSPSVSTAVRPFTVAPGGILPSTTTPSGLYVGQFWDDGTNLRRWNGSTWDTYQKMPGASTSWTPTWTTSTGTHSPSFGTNSTIDCRYFKLGRLVVYNMNIVFGSTANFGSGATTGDNWQFSLPFTSAMASYPVGTVTFEPGTSRAVAGNAVTTSDGLNLQFNIASGAVNGTALSSGVVDSLSPWTWATGNKFHVVGQYEATS